MPRKTVTTPVRVNLINPGATHARIRARLMPGADPMTLPTPDRAADAIVTLCLPSLEETRRLYDVPQARFLDYCRPECVLRPNQLTF